MANNTQTTNHNSLISDLCQQLHAAASDNIGTETEHQNQRLPQQTDLPVIPRNALTNKPYQGINTVLLWSVAHEQEFKSREWATFKQWSSIGKSVRKGETGTVIIHYKSVAKDANGTIANLATLRLYRVFNREQLQRE